MSSPAAFANLADARSLALHAAVADLLANRADLVERAKVRVAAWLADPKRHPYASEWKTLLDGGVEHLRAALVSKDAQMCTLRQASPFAGAIDSRTRWSILKRAELRPREAS